MAVAVAKIATRACRVAAAPLAPFCFSVLRSKAHLTDSPLARRTCSKSLKGHSGGRCHELRLGDVAHIVGCRDDINVTKWNAPTSGNLSLYCMLCHEECKQVAALLGSLHVVESERNNIKQLIVV